MLFRQFGHVYDDYQSMGINGKNSEFHAAMGLCVYDQFSSILDKRKQIHGWYTARLTDNSLYFPDDVSKSVDWNHSYVPVVFSSEKILLDVIKALAENKIVPRRYFYPSLNKMSFVPYQPCPVSEDISARVLCLPSFHDLTEDDVHRIAGVVNSVVC
jgi:dTDP-4-amino-4,6-dideoxygalactose transaminase